MLPSLALRTQSLLTETRDFTTDLGGSQTARLTLNYQEHHRGDGEWAWNLKFCHFIYLGCLCILGYETSVISFVIHKRDEPDDAESSKGRPPRSLRESRFSVTTSHQHGKANSTSQSSIPGKGFTSTNKFYCSSSKARPPRRRRSTPKPLERSRKRRKSSTPGYEYRSLRWP